MTVPGLGRDPALVARAVAEFLNPLLAGDGETWEPGAWEWSGVKRKA